MARFELTIQTLNKDYVDELVVCLARQGYAPYIKEEGDVCIEISDDELVKLDNKLVAPSIRA